MAQIGVHFRGTHSLIDFLITAAIVTLSVLMYLTDLFQLGQF